MHNQKWFGLGGARWFFAALSTAVLLPLPVLAQSGVSGGDAMDSPEATVRSVMMSLAGHYQSGDLDAAGQLFAEGRGVHIIEGTGANHGWADYRDHHLAPELEAPLHFDLARSIPVADSTVHAAPTELRLWFTEEPQDGTTAVRVMNAAGEMIPTGGVMIMGPGS